MESTTKKLWNRNFSLIAFCNAVALLGNMTLSFALAYYVRDITGSEAMFGLALSAPYISMLIMSPIGGIMADRLRKQRIMFWIDVSVVALILLYMAATGLSAAVLPIVFVKLLALNAVQGVYMSATQAALPFVVPVEKLTSGNAIFGMVNALVGAAGQALAAVLYGNFGLYPILIPFAILYGFTAIMDLLIRIPFKKQKAESSIARMVKNDISQAMRFMIKEKPVLAKLGVFAFLVIASIISMLMIGTPILITDTLGMDLSFVGISQVFMAVGGLGGGILSGVMGAKLTVRKLPLLLMLAGIAPIPIGSAILLNAPASAVFIIITAVCALSMFIATLMSVVVMTYFQVQTPPELLGKILALFAMLPFLANAVGQFAFGVLFETLSPWTVVFIAAFVGVVTAIFSSRSLRSV